uniref:RxLR effector candidate protein n=2 Tax=Hyaloperonospora arabidopsidis (strain Emoy2) TaxID=559515 RepID=M4BAM2_HYAAE
MIAPGKLILTAAFALFLLDDADFVTATATLRLRSTLDDRTAEGARSLRASERAVDKNLKLEEERMNVSALLPAVGLRNQHAPDELTAEMAVIAQLSGKSTKADNIKWLANHAKLNRKKKESRYAEWYYARLTHDQLKAAYTASGMDPKIHSGVEEMLEEYLKYSSVSLLKAAGWNQEKMSIKAWLDGVEKRGGKKEYHEWMLTHRFSYDRLRQALQSAGCDVKKERVALTVLENYNSYLIDLSPTLKKGSVL